MGVNEITQLVGSLGFPIVSCIWLYYYVAKQDSTHAETIKGLTDALTDMKVVMVQLVDKLGRSERSPNDKEDS